ncbi:hypothetical protein BHF71_06285 [Vulcanibacillus modesticaldus]|uniref:Uncharacterized protein n=1 Tax=Vulcanibacillus modesticaldus TaxID=337097 RepID=A0A1D2YWP0_9BACI|nr:M23 family metallopeptidase [Vulcanibacillus modesticaldus]OEG00129.1 hypothetical protein BHF71_06285 [Vulcanibacillus modesticaldus]
MKKNRVLSVVLVFTLLITLIIPGFEVKAGSEWQKLDQQIQEIKKKKQEAARRSQNIDAQIAEIRQEKEEIEKELISIELEIDQTEQKLFSLEQEIEDVTAKAKTAADELEQATKRVEKRKKLLKTRVRLMYRKGDVQYLEVLLGSNNFADFLQRFSALQKIVESDRKILTDNIRDKKTIEAKKKEIDEHLANLRNLYDEAEKIKLSLVAKRKERKVKIATLNQAEQELKEYKEEEEKLLDELAEKEAELLRKQYELKYNGAAFVWPVPASTRITSDFGLRKDPITGVEKGHKGLDIGRAPGTATLYGADIIAAADGVVIVASYVRGFGNTVIINHGSGIWTLYAHIRNGGIMVKVGQKVSKGQKIAEVGSTGRSTGPHLHFEVRKNNKAVSPWDYIPR